MRLEDHAHELPYPSGSRSLAPQTVTRPLRAVEHIRRMRGGSQAQLMRCSDGNYYVVKFQDNPQGTRVLANELLGTRLAGRLGLPIAINHVVLVSEELIRYSREMVFELASGSTPCTGGLCFGSRFLADPRQVQVSDLLPGSLFCDLENISDFCGMLVFDKWTCNTDGRQAVFFRRKTNSSHSAVMIDQGMCFNGAGWNFPDAPLRSLYRIHPAYERVCGMDDFEPWLTRLETEISADVLSDVANDIPPEWFAFDSASIQRLLERLNYRRGKVRELLLLAHEFFPGVFPNWAKKNGTKGEKNHVLGDPASSAFARMNLVDDVHGRLSPDPSALL
jgi:hypothetical protein